MKQTELYNAIAPEDRSLMCPKGCGIVEPMLEEIWDLLKGIPRLYIQAACPRCGESIKWAKQLRQGSLEAAPW